MKLLKLKSTTFGFVFSSELFMVEVLLTEPFGKFTLGLKSKCVSYSRDYAKIILEMFLFQEALNRGICMFKILLFIHFNAI